MENKIYTKWWFWTLIIIAFLGFCSYLFFQSSTFINNYQKQSINILNEYRQGEITNTEAKEKIETLSKKADKEYENGKSTKNLFLTGILQRIELDLTKGELSDTEVSTYIQEIKTIKEI